MHKVSQFSNRFGNAGELAMYRVYDYWLVGGGLILLLGDIHCWKQNEL